MTDLILPKQLDNKKFESWPPVVSLSTNPAWAEQLKIAKDLYEDPNLSPAIKLDLIHLLYYTNFFLEQGSDSTHYLSYTAIGHQLMNATPENTMIFSKWYAGLAALPGLSGLSAIIFLAIVCSEAIPVAAVVSILCATLLLPIAFMSIGRSLDQQVDLKQAAQFESVKGLVRFFDGAIPPPPAFLGSTDLPIPHF